MPILVKDLPAITKSANSTHLGYNCTPWCAHWGGCSNCRSQSWNSACVSSYPAPGLTWQYTSWSFSSSPMQKPSWTQLHETPRTTGVLVTSNPTSAHMPVAAVPLLQGQPCWCERKVKNASFPSCVWSILILGAQDGRPHPAALSAQGQMLGGGF